MIIEKNKQRLPSSRAELGQTEMGEKPFQITMIEMLPVSILCRLFRSACSTDFQFSSRNKPQISSNYFAIKKSHEKASEKSLENSGFDNAMKARLFVGPS